MADNPYKIELGIKLDTSDLQTQVNRAGDNIKPIDIKVDAETKELTKTINEALKNLSKGSKNALTLDTSKLEASLNDVTSTIKEIKTAIGALDSGSGMKSLVSSINSINTALDKASDKFDVLIGDLKSLSGKDFNLNFGITMGGSNPVARQTAYGNKARNETLPQLKQQMNALVKHYNDTYKDSADEIIALQRLVSGTKLNTGDFFQSFMFGKDSVASRMNGGSLSSQMQAYKQYIDMFKQAASLKGLDISSVTSQFSKSADQLIQDAQDIQTGAKEMDDGFEKLKQIFGGSNNFNVDGISQQLDNIVVDLGEIKTALQGLSSGVSLEGLTQSFDKLSDTLEKLTTNAKVVQDVLGSTNTNAGMSNQAKQAQETADAYKEVANEAKKLGNISIDISDGSVNDLKNALRNIVDDSEILDIEKVTKELNEMNIVAKNVSGTFRDGNLIKLDIKGVQTTADGLERVATITKTFGRDGVTTSEKYSQSLDKIAIAAQKVRDKLNGTTTGFNGFENEIEEVCSDVKKLEQSSQGLENALRELDVAFQAINLADEANDSKRLVDANKEYEIALEKVRNQLKLIQQAQKEAYATENLDLKKQAASLDIDNYLKNNTKAAKEFGDVLRRLQREINACDDSTAFLKLEREIKNVKKQANSTLTSTQSFGDKIKKQWQQYSSYLSVSSLFMYAEQGLRSMFEQVKLIDSAMTELKKVTNETDAAYKEFLTNAATRSREIGTTIDGLVSSTADFARLGYGFEDAQGLAEVANIYAVVGDEIEGVEGATESLISTMAAFKGEMNGMSNTDFAMSIIDKFNEIGNNFAISSGGIGEALERSASSLMAANNTIDESIALITAA